MSAIRLIYPRLTLQCRMKTVISASPFSRQSSVYRSLYTLLFTISGSINAKNKQIQNTKHDIQICRQSEKAQITICLFIS